MKEEKIKDNMLQKYSENLRGAGIRVPALLWILIALAAVIASALISFGIITSADLPINPLILSILIALLVADVMLAFPIYISKKRIAQMEAALPTALKQIADSLKAGATYEFALRDATQADFGPLTKELKLSLRKLEEGANLQDSLRHLYDNIDSRLIKRAVAIIIDAIKSGAPLADILEDIADDIRAMHQVAIERRARTLMQVLFIATAGAIVAPAILGIISTIVHLFAKVSQGVGIIPKEVIKQSIASMSVVEFFIQLYLIIQIVISSAMISLMREG
ncbi:MAG: type II secretion system F family protein, partial [Candidatus Diapherotrites archaeon]|nr:type II secretion system F family protein [Candidatus Diapherotrites archaeon]